MKKQGATQRFEFKDKETKASTIDSKKAAFRAGARDEGNQQDE